MMDVATKEGEGGAWAGLGLAFAWHSAQLPGIGHNDGIAPKPGGWAKMLT